MTVHVVLDPATLTVEPGEEAVCTVRIRNDGDIVDEFTAEVIGEVGGWALLEADAVRLFPGDDGALVLHLRPPRAHHVAPGRVPFGVRVVGVSSQGKASAVAEATLEVTPFHQVEAAITPRRSRARLMARHRVAVRNSGNVPASVKLSGFDPDDMIDVRFRKPQLELAPGQQRVVRARVRPGTISFASGPEPHPFTVAVEPEEGLPTELEAAMVVRPLVPLWLPLALGVLAIAIVLIVSLIRHDSVQTLATTGSLGGASPSPGASGAASAKAASGSSGGGGGGGGATAAPATAATPTPAPLSSTEAACLGGMTIPQGSHYLADGTAQDTGPNHANGTLSGGTTYGPGQSSAATDKAFSFPGGTSTVDLGKSVGQFGSSDFCASLAIKTSTVAQQALIGNRNSSTTTGRFWDIRLDASGQPYAEIGSVSVTGYAPVADGAWHRVCVIRSNVLINVYVDGRLVGTLDTGPIANVSDGASTHLGGDGYIPYTGEIDNVIVVQG